MRRDGTVFRHGAALFYSFWGVQIVLRLFSLGRSDAFGFPAVNKFDWYIFHAVAFDWLWSLPLIAPLVLFGLFGGERMSRAGRAVFGGTAAVFAVVLLLTVVDQELFRFMSMHFNRTMMETYGNAGSVRELFGMLGADQSVPWLPVILFFGAVPLLFFLYRRLAPRVQSIGKNGVAILLLTLLFWSYTEWIWGGTFRERRLAPVVKVLFFSSDRSGVELGEGEQSRLTAEFREEWLRAQGDSCWEFGPEEYPYYKSPRPTVGEVRCGDESSGDDTLSEHPGEPNRPPNLIVAILESHRAVNSGLFFGEGSWAQGTPLLDSLAEQGEHWSRFYAGGVPTIGALAAIHLGIPDHPHRHIISSMTQLRASSFPELLRSVGYQTHFFSSADPVWDNQVPWLNRWYDRWHYDRTKEEDQVMFAGAAEWAIDSLDRSRPFLLTLMTKTNHYPFNRVEGMDPYSDSLTLQDRMLRTMRYTEEGLSRFLNRMGESGLLEGTVIVVLADHGFSLGLRPEEHGSGQIGHGLYSEHTWVPLVLAGDHPRLRRGFRNDEPASQADLAPTLLDLAGVRLPNSFAGHSLVRRAGKEFATAEVFKEGEGAVDRGGWRGHAGWDDPGRERGEELFDGVRDRNELNDLSKLYPDTMALFSLRIKERGRLHAWTVEQNRLVPPESSAAPKK